MQSPRRIVLTFATGHEQYRTMAKALAISLRLYDCDARLVCISDEKNDKELNDLFDQVIDKPSGYDHWFMKLSGLEITDADEILFIDGDCLALSDPNRIFDELQECDFAVQGKWLSQIGNWYGDIDRVMSQLNLKEIPKFSGGFLYYRRTEEAQQLIERIMDLQGRYDELGLQRNGGKVVDEVCISLAMAQSGIGTVVPDSRQYSLTPWRRMGPIHLDVLRGECRFMRSMPELELARPTIYHTAMAKWDFAYWREVKKLLRAYRYPQAVFMEQGAASTIRFKLRRIGVMIARKFWGI